jgi:hypothetical protein
LKQFLKLQRIFKTDRVLYPGSRFLQPAEPVVKKLCETEKNMKKYEKCEKRSSDGIIRHPRFKW